MRVFTCQRIISRQTWLQSVGTCDVLEKYIMRFVRSRNGKRFVECVSGDQDPIMKKLARSLKIKTKSKLDGGGSWKV